MTPDKTITVSFDPPTEENWDSYMAVPTIGEQHDLPAGAVERVQALIDAAHYMVWCYRIAPRDIGGGAAGSSARSTGSLGTRESLDKRAASAASPRVPS